MGCLKHHQQFTKTHELCGELLMIFLVFLPHYYVEILNLPMIFSYFFCPSIRVVSTLVTSSFEIADRSTNQKLSSLSSPSP